MLVNKNDWFVRHARRILQERAAAGTLGQLDTRKASPDGHRAFIAAVAAACVRCGRCTSPADLPNDVISGLLGSQDEYVRAWAIQLSLDRENPNLASLRRHFVALAQSDRRRSCDCILASALQRMPLARAVEHPCRL